MVLALFDPSQATKRSLDQEKLMFFFEKQSFSSPRMTPVGEKCQLLRPEPDNGSFPTKKMLK